MLIKNKMKQGSRGSLFFFSLMLGMFVSSLALTACSSDDDDEPGNGGKAANRYFSISPTKKVVFSPGNLQYRASTDTWRFAAHQYDIIGEDNQKVSSVYTGWIDLFGWGTGDAPCKVSTSADDYSSFSDWGMNIADDKVWFTMTKEEWDYFYEKHVNRWIVVEGISGRVFLPDGATISIDSEWSQLEAAGAVFLPEAGFRNGKTVGGVGVYGYYWAATPYETAEAYELSFYPGYVYSSPYSRVYGLSVRLVRLADI